MHVAPSSSPAAAVGPWCLAAAPLPRPASPTSLPTLYAAHSETTSFDQAEDVTGSRHSRTSRTATASGRHEAACTTTMLRPGVEYCRLSSCFRSATGSAATVSSLLSCCLPFVSLVPGQRRQTDSGEGIKSCRQSPQVTATTALERPRQQQRTMATKITELNLFNLAAFKSRCPSARAPRQPAASYGAVRKRNTHSLRSKEPSLLAVDRAACGDDNRQSAQVAAAQFFLRPEENPRKSSINSIHHIEREDGQDERRGRRAEETKVTYSQPATTTGSRQQQPPAQQCRKTMLLHHHRRNATMLFSWRSLCTG